MCGFIQLKADLTILIRLLTLITQTLCSRVVTNLPNKKSRMRRRVRNGADRGNVQLNYAVPLAISNHELWRCGYQAQCSRPNAYDDQTEHRVTADEPPYRPK